MEKQFLSINEVAELLGVSRLTVHRLIDKGELPVLAVLRRRLIPKEALEAFIEANTSIRKDPVTRALEEAGR